MATVEAQLRTLEDSKVAEAEKHAQEMRTLESTLNAAHAGKKVSTQQHIAHCMFKEAQTEICLIFGMKSDSISVLACFCLEQVLMAHVWKCVQQLTTQQQHVQSDTQCKQRVCGEQVLEGQHKEVKDNLSAAKASKTAVLRKLEKQSSSFKESLKVTLHAPSMTLHETACLVLEV